MANPRAPRDACWGADTRQLLGGDRRARGSGGPAQARALPLTRQHQEPLQLPFCSRDTWTSGFLRQMAVRPRGGRSSRRDTCHRLGGLETTGTHRSRFWKLQVQDNGCHGRFPRGHRPVARSSPSGRGRELWGPRYKGLSPIQEASPPSRPNHPPAEASRPDISPWGQDPNTRTYGTHALGPQRGHRQPRERLWQAAAAGTSRLLTRTASPSTPTARDVSRARAREPPPRLGQRVR